MKLEFKKEQDIVTVLLNGRLDNAAVNNIASELEPLNPAPTPSRSAM